MIIHNLEKLSTIKRIDELERPYEALTPVKQYNRWAMGDAGNFHIPDNEELWKEQWLFIYEIPVGVPRLKISKLSILSKTTDTDIYVAQEIKNNPKRYAWDVCGFFSIEGGLSDNFADVKHEMVSNKTIQVQDLNKRERLGFTDPVKMDVCVDFFEKNPGKKLYLIVSATSEPIVEPIKYQTEGEYYFLEEPVAEIVRDGSRLSESRIMCGRVGFNGKEIKNGIFLWQASSTTVWSNGMDYRSYKAVFFKPVAEFRPWIRDFRFFCNPKNFHISRKKAFLKTLHHYEPVGVFDLCVPIESQKNSRFETYVWSKNLLSDVDVLEKKVNLDAGPYSHKNLVNYRSHHEYGNLHDGFSLDSIYADCKSIVEIAPEKAARIIVRDLLKQPKEHRYISIDGNSVLRWLMGGPIRIADEIEMSDDTDSYKAKIKKAKTEEEKQKWQKALDDRIQTLRDIRYEKDYLYSMVYFGEDDLSTEDKFSGDGFFFYDAPIHFNAPKIKNVPNEIKEKYNKIFEMLYFNPYVHKEGHDVHENISGCEALANLLDKVFAAVAAYGVEIDYVTCDIEMMRNTAHDMKNVHRMELKDDFIDDSHPVYNSPVDADDDSDIFHRMWNSLWNAFERRKEMEIRGSYRDIFNKLLTRGFVAKKTGHKLDSVALSNIDQYSYVYANDYPERRNLNIWDQVALEYYAGVFDMFMMAPIRKYSPKMVCSTHAVSESKGYVHYSDEFERYLGGNVKLPAKMTSIPGIYALASKSIYKHCMDNWKALPDDDSPFSYLVTTVNCARTAKFSNPRKSPQPFIASVYYWTWQICKTHQLLSSSYANYSPETNDVDDKKKDRDQFIELCNSGEVSNLAVSSHKYYKELLLHTWLCNPKSMYAYLNYHDHSFSNEKFDHRVFKLSADGTKTEFKKVYQEEYNQDVYKAIQDAANEMKRITCGRAPRLITSALASETNPFLLTGVRIGRIKLYRFTVNDNVDVDFYPSEPLPSKPYSLKLCDIVRLPVSKLRDLGFILGEKKVLFRDALLLDCCMSKGRLSKNGPKGFWIAMPWFVTPKITTDYRLYQKNPAIDMKMASYDFNSGWPSRIIVNNKDLDKNNDKIPIEEHRIIPYTRLNRPEIVSVFGELARKQKMMTSVTFDKVDENKTVLGVTFNPKGHFNAGKEYVFERSYNIDSPRDEEQQVYAPLISGNFVVPAKLKVYSGDRPVTYIDIYSGATQYVSWYKSYIQGMNFRVDVFRESDGVNISRVNKACNVAYANLPVDTSCDDFLRLRVSWLNATEHLQHYKVICAPRFEKTIRFPLKLFSRSYKIPAGSEKYKLYKIGRAGSFGSFLDVYVEQNGKRELVYSIPINGR